MLSLSFSKNATLSCNYWAFIVERQILHEENVARVMALVRAHMTNPDYPIADDKNVWYCVLHRYGLAAQIVAESLPRSLTLSRLHFHANKRYDDDLKICIRALLEYLQLSLLCVAAAGL